MMLSRLQATPNTNGQYSYTCDYCYIELLASWSSSSVRRRSHRRRAGTGSVTSAIDRHPLAGPTHTDGYNQIIAAGRSEQEEPRTPETNNGWHAYLSSTCSINPTITSSLHSYELSARRQVQMFELTTSTCWVSLFQKNVV